MWSRKTPRDGSTAADSPRRWPRAETSAAGGWTPWMGCLPVGVQQLEDELRVVRSRDKARQVSRQRARGGLVLHREGMVSHDWRLRAAGRHGRNQDSRPLARHAGSRLHGTPP